MTNLATNIISINNYEIEEKIYKGQKVLSFTDIDGVHNRRAGTASRNFNENRMQFTKNLDYYLVKRDDYLHNEFRCVPPAGITLFTEQGCKMLIKSFTDQKSWDIQRELVSSYYVGVNTNTDDILRTVLSKLNIMETKIEMLAEEKNKLSVENKTLSSEKKNLIFDKEILKKDLRTQIHKNPLLTKRSNVCNKLREDFFAAEFENKKTSKIYEEALNIISRTQLKDMSKLINSATPHDFTDAFDTNDLTHTTTPSWAIYCIAVGYMYLHKAMKNVYACQLNGGMRYIMNSSEILLKGLENKYSPMQKK